MNFLKDIKKTGGKFLLKTDEYMWIFTGTEPTQFYRENIIIFLSDGEDAVPCNEHVNLIKIMGKSILTDCIHAGFESSQLY